MKKRIIINPEAIIKVSIWDRRLYTKNFIDHKASKYFLGIKVRNEVKAGFYEYCPFLGVQRLSENPEYYIIDNYKLFYKPEIQIDLQGGKRQVYRFKTFEEATTWVHDFLNFPNLKIIQYA